MTPVELRLIAALLIVGIAVGGYVLLNKLLLSRTNRSALGLKSQLPNTPAILYFTTPNCVPCRTTQRPAIARLLEITGNQVQLIEVDASSHSEVAESWGVLSVPTTFIIDSDGQARKVNHGVTSSDQLLWQLEQAEGRSLTRNPALKIRTKPAGLQGTD